MIKSYETGGGVVLNAANQILLLERHIERDGEMCHEFRLPKGKIEKAESAVQAALREVCEESGYCDLTVLAPLGSALTTFTHRGSPYIRHEHYFLLRLMSDAPPQPTPHSAEEALFQPLWVEDFAATITLLTYPAEQDVMQRAFITYWELESSIP